MLRGMLMLSMLPLAKSPAPTSAMLQLVKDGQPLEDTAGGVRRCVDTVPRGVLEEHDCSPAAPCWALVKEDKRLAPFAGGVQLKSVNSMALLRTFSHGTGCAQSAQAPRSLRGVFNYNILTALYAMDPTSYLFAYRTADSTVRYRPRPPPPRAKPGGALSPHLAPARPPRATRP